MSYAPIYVGDVKVDQLTFGSVDNSGGKTKVEIYRDNTSVAKNNRLNKMHLCRDACVPMECRYPLDSVRDDGNPLRRGLMVKVTDEATRDALRAIDRRVVMKAVESSKEWFKKQLSEEQVLARYKPILQKAKEEDDFECVKLAIKCPGSEYPTSLHLRDANGKYRKNAASINDLTYGSSVVPIVSASYGIWFMGGGSSFGVKLQAEEMIVTPGDAASDSLDHFPSSRPLEMAEDTKDVSSTNDQSTTSFLEAAQFNVELMERDASRHTGEGDAA